MIRERHPELAQDLLLSLEGGANTPALSAACEAVLTLTGVMGFTPRSWTALSKGGPPDWQREDFEPGVEKGGWQHETISRVEQSFLEVRVSPLLPESGRAREVRVALAAAWPSRCHLATLSPAESNSPAFSRCHASRPFSHFCLCGRLLDAFGHPQLALVLEFWGDGVRIGECCRPAGKQEGVSPLTCRSDIWTWQFQTHSMVGVWRWWRTGCLFGQLWCHFLHAHGSPHRHAADTDGAVLVAARRRKKERTCHELVGPEKKAWSSWLL